MLQSDDLVVIQPPASAQLEIMIVDQVVDGTPVATVAEATAAIKALAEVTPAGSLNTQLGEMQVVDIADGPTTNSVLTFAAPRWVVPRSGRLWMIEVDNGVLLISVGILEGSAQDGSTSEIIDLGEAVARTIRLGE